ncbi:SMP-30/gluconolaconase/LRE-like region family protein [Burkholderia sp. Ac-20379]|uniref:SMP-30/gluconolaconase/LRE-like region family protein n=1 Tax=Burkholderia sp. Ac-20379 TaxID=2703900 RepID=UPI0019819D61|nr:SMP-30/gluconolaconase/LRE-like region family protein [Burkholderia sp. Ac-20379]MBN3723849.1 SMP-30/gluconolaconase/LRE-like region family protein [Burkholderia sp. Ac-20379]
MVMQRMRAVIVTVCLAALTPAALAQTSTDWIANTYGTIASHVGNGARSMWVAPEGTIYTASFWDENAGGVGVYQNGKTLGSIGTHAEFQGGAITGNATSIFTPLQGAKLTGTVARYNRATGLRDLAIKVSVWDNLTKVDVITGLATAGTLLYASDYFSNRVRVFTTDGVWQRDIPIATPGALTLDAAGNLWVAQKNSGTVVEIGPTGTQLNTIQIGASARPSALYYDAPSGQLMVGDSGPDMNIKRYAIAGQPALAGTFGVTGGYLDATTGIKGQVGAQRFTRVVGIGRDAAGVLYVLNNPWGGGWDLGRNGTTDLQAYDGSGNLAWALQALNFEAVAAPDPVTDGALFYSGMNIYSGSAGGQFVANTVDPFSYPNDPRLSMTDYQRGQHFGQLASVGGNRILVATGQNPDIYNFYHFNPAASGYIAIPDGSLPGALFGTNAIVTGGFSIDENGDVWAGMSGSSQVTHYPFAGFDASGKPSWRAGVAMPVPGTVKPITRVIYQAPTDTMVLAQGIAGSWDWTAMNGHLEVYHGWLAGNRTPNPVIDLSSPNPKTIAVAGRYLFVGYVHTVPNIDVFDLSTGSLVTTLVNTNSTAMDVGNDVDSMFGLRAYLRSTGEYVITKDNYNGSSIVVYRWTPQ